MTEAERKWKIRSAHRGSATRMMHSSYEAMGAAEISVTKLKQLRQTLSEKLDTLATLDAQLLEVTEEDQLEAELNRLTESERRKLFICSICNGDSNHGYPSPFGGG